MIDEMKKALRKELKSISFSFETKKEREKSIIKQILESESYKHCEMLLLFAGKGTEPDLTELFIKAVAQNKVVCYPKCIDKGIMTFHRVTDLSQLKTGEYGIMEPVSDCCEITDFKNTLCITPAVAYTKDLKRLGHGGGYYDRFLSKHNCRIMGVIFKEYIVNDIPRNETDINVDELIYA